MVGEAGKELFSILGEAFPDTLPELHWEIRKLFKYGQAWTRDRNQWLEAAGIAMTNVFALRPHANKIEELCVSKKEVGKDYPLPYLQRSKYLREEYFGELERLAKEVEEFNPNLIVALGNTATWAFLGSGNIGKIRGAITSTSSCGYTRLSREYKLLPTYHPAGILRQWAWRPILSADLMKAKREGEFPEIRRPDRTIVINPTLKELRGLVQQVLENPPPLLSVDTETGSGQIKCIGFAPSRHEAFLVPFLDEKKPGYSYWPSHWEEVEAWTLVAKLLESPIPKLWQNGVYDLQYLTPLGIMPQACLEDTMLLHHSLFPELQKGLGFLGSIYTSEASWKLMVKHRADEVEKKDE